MALLNILLVGVLGLASGANAQEDGGVKEIIRINLALEIDHRSGSVDERELEVLIPLGEAFTVRDRGMELQVAVAQAKEGLEAQIDYKIRNTHDAFAMIIQYDVEATVRMETDTGSVRRFEATLLVSEE